MICRHFTLRWNGRNKGVYKCHDCKKILKLEGAEEDIDITSALEYI